MELIDKCLCNLMEVSGDKGRRNSGDDDITLAGTVVMVVGVDEDE